MTPALSALFQEAKAGIEGIFTHYLANPNIPSPLLKAMETSIKNGGKRLRPMLVLASARLFNVSSHQAARVGAPIEMIHSYSLIHDDLPAMDNADTRRGHPSCWREFGEATAILAGDSLLPLAFEVLTDEATHSSPSVRLTLIQRLAQDSGAAGMAGGQILDLSPHLIDSIDKATTMQNLKTGCLIAFSCESGAILGQASPEERSRLRHFGFLLGLAYQIQDDLLDIEGNTQTLGKPVGMDADKRSLVTLLGIDKSKEYLYSLQKEMFDLIRPYQLPIFDDIIQWVGTREV
ncbi:MAG: polyprenyl synthetase family protein [Alphaproteobacteria bacterium]|nr:polyprenyl synthetase family protein [Alphaproteobacteria bacterium]